MSRPDSSTTPPTASASGRAASGAARSARCSRTSGSAAGTNGPDGPVYPHRYVGGVRMDILVREAQERGAVMSRKKVLVLGGNFAGLTAALAVRRELHGDVDVRVVSASDRFLFNPSLIWLPFGKRSPADITFPLAPVF